MNIVYHNKFTESQNGSKIKKYKCQNCQTNIQYYDTHRHKENVYQNKDSNHRWKRQYHKVDTESKEVDDTNKSNLYQCKFIDDNYFNNLNSNFQQVHFIEDLKKEDENFR